SVSSLRHDPAPHRHAGVAFGQASSPLPPEPLAGREAAMTEHYSDRRKIDPTKGARLPDGSPNDNDRIEIGPTQLAFREWEAAGLTLPDLPRMREFRWKRLTRHVVDRGWGGILLFDPLNIRYA